MNKNFWTIAAGGAALTVALVTTPAYSARQESHASPAQKVQEFNFSFGDEGASWLGVETQDVSADRAREFKLPAERGALLAGIVPDSPASKAGLKENDVVLDINGQHVESAMQFRRMIREIPAGRAVQLTVWRDGRTETINATLGKSAESHHGMTKVAPGTPGTFAFRMPEIPELPDVVEIPAIPEIPEIPEMGWEGNMMYFGQPRLGIDAEDLNGQLGKFFGAPEGEGILVRSVNSGSPAEKGGLKAGDVITSVNGNRIRSVGDLRQKLSSRHEEKEKSEKATAVKLGILRNKSELSLTVEIPESAPKLKHLAMHHTNI
jgi:serine protease Do